MTNRWCGARQMVIDAARDLIGSKECTYAIEGLDKQAKAAKVAKFLDEEAFHFRKTTSVGNLRPEIYATIHQMFRVPRTRAPRIRTPKSHPVSPTFSRVAVATVLNTRRKYLKGRTTAY